MGRKKVLIIGVIVFFLGFVGVFIYVNRDNLFPVVEEENSMSVPVSNVNDFVNNSFYVFHNDKSKNISEIDFNTIVSSDSFRICPVFDQNWDNKHDTSNHVIWTNTSNDVNIPTLYEGDLLLYVSSSDIPFKGIEWERFSDYGYSIGVVNFIKDESGHYHINCDEDSYINHIYEKSDAVDLLQFDYVTELFLNKLGKIDVREDLVSDNGTIANLDKGGSYVCEWYTGTYYQDFKMIADVHPFCSFESFKTYDYDFLHSNCISITIPDWFKSGYYFVNGIGFFRYVDSSDSKLYNGEPYDSSISWNDPIIIKNADGKVVFDPSTDYVDKKYAEENGIAIESSDKDLLNNSDSYSSDESYDDYYNNPDDFVDEDQNDNEVPYDGTTQGDGLYEGLPSE